MPDFRLLESVPDALPKGHPDRQPGMALFPANLREGLAAGMGSVA